MLTRINNRALRIFIIGTTFISAIIIIGADYAFAQGAKFESLANYDRSFLADAYSTDGLNALVNNLFLMALSFGGIAAVLRFAYAGYLYLGSDMWGNKQHAREILGDTALGLLLLLAIALILTQINPDILNLDVLSQLQSTSGSVNTGAPANSGGGFGSVE
jgi:hypothetical protein